MRVRTLVVDDERTARRPLCDLVSGIEWMELVGEAESGARAVELIDAEEPDLVYLDIRMPDVSGLGVLERVAHRPEVVFTTAYEDHAIPALRLGALDYLVKPFGRRRFLESAERIRPRLAARETAAARPARVYVEDRGSIIPLEVRRIERIEARADFAALWVERRRLLARSGIGQVEPLLDPERFVRVHRSHIVNLDHVAAFRPRDDRRLLVVMKDGTELVASRAGSRLIRRRLI